MRCFFSFREKRLRLITDVVYWIITKIGNGAKCTIDEWRRCSSVDKSGKKLFCVHVCVHTKQRGGACNSIYAIWCLMCTIICAESLPIHQDELLFACLCRVEGRVSTENQCVTFVCRWIYFQISADCYMRWSVLGFLWNIVDNQVRGNAMISSLLMTSGHNN